MGKGLMPRRQANACMLYLLNDTGLLLRPVDTNRLTNTARIIKPKVAAGRKKLIV